VNASSSTSRVVGGLPGIRQAELADLSFDAVPEEVAGVIGQHEGQLSVDLGVVGVTLFRPARTSQTLMAGAR
jgi:hypothetical protein